MQTRSIFSFFLSVAPTFVAHIQCPKVKILNCRYRYVLSISPNID